MEGSIQSKVTRCREELASAVVTNNYNDSSTRDAIQELLNIDVPLLEKFVVLNFCDLLVRNAESAESLKRLIMALNILEKYGRHLLKPAESRSDMWRQIKYSNSIFRDRVDPIQGGREIMNIMGYTVNKRDGVAFPEGAKPNQEKVLNLVIDIVQAKKELEAYLMGKHKYPHYIETYIQPELVKEVQGMEGSSEGAAQTKPQGSVEPALPTGSGSKGPGKTAPTSIPASGAMAGLVQQGSVPSPQVTKGPEQQVPISYQSPVSSHVPEHQAPVSVAAVNQGQYGDTGHQGTQNISSPPPVESSNSTSHIDQGCDICNNKAVLMCQACEGKPLCQECDTKWHKHPRRQNHKRPHVIQEVPPQSQTTEAVLTGKSNSPGLNQNYGMVPNFPSTMDPPLHHQQQQYHQQQQRDQQQYGGYMPGAGGSTLPREPASMFYEPGANQVYDLPRHSLPHNMHQMTPGRPIHMTQVPGHVRPDLPIYYTQQHQTRAISPTWNTLGTNPAAMLPTSLHNTGMHSPPWTGPMPSHMGTSQQQGIYMGHGTSQQQVLFPSSGGTQVTASHDDRFPHSQLPTAPLGMYTPGQHIAHYAANYTPGGDPNLTSNYTAGDPNLTTHYTPGDPNPVRNYTQSDLNLPTVHHPPKLSPYGNKSSSPTATQPGATAAAKGLPPLLIRPGETTTKTADVNLGDPISHPEIGRTPSTASTPSISNLLPNIIAVKDLEKRRARIEISLMTLKEDVSAWDARSNEIMLGNPNFYLDQEYQDVNRKKRKHLQEINELSNYAKDLDKEIAEKADMEEKERMNKSFEKELNIVKDKAARLRLDEVINQVQPPPGSPVGLGYNPADIDQQKYRNPAQVRTSQAPAATSGLGPSITGSSQQRQENQLVSSATSNKIPETPPPLKLSSLGEGDSSNMEEIRRMLCADVNPFDHKSRLDDSTMNIPISSMSPADITALMQGCTTPEEFGQRFREQDAACRRQAEEAAQNQHQHQHQNVVNQSGARSKAPSTIIVKGPPHSSSVPDIQNESLGAGVPRSQSAVDLVWECEHCTYINKASQKACDMCYKTSDNPKFSQPNTLSTGKPMAGQQISIEKQTEACKFCTYHNKPGFKVCEMCARTPARAMDRKPAQEAVEQTEEEMVIVEHGDFDEQALLESAAPYPRQADVGVLQTAAGGQTHGGAGAMHSGISQQQTMGQMSTADAGQGECQVELAQAGSVMAGSAQDQQTVRSSNVGKLIEADQDQVYLEKKAAKEEFERRERLAASGQSGGLAAGTGATSGHMAGVGATSGHMTGAEAMEGVGPLKGDLHTPPSSVQNKPGDKVASDATVSRSQHSPGRGSKHVALAAKSDSPRGSLDRGTIGSADGGKMEASGGGGDSKMEIGGSGDGKMETGGAGGSKMKFEDEIEQISLNREREKQTLDGHDFMSLIKEAENSGYDIEEIKIALNMGTKDDMQASDWLKLKWASMVELVVNMSTEAGKKAEQNDVGDLSTEEAKEVLINCGGSVDRAVTECVTDRKKKYAKISKLGEFAREEILTALFQNQGDANESLDQLNNSVVQAYVDRVWTLEEEARADGMMAAAAAARMDDLNNSVSSSAISQPDFQNMIKDTSMDKERRIRMVFVEGKLRSWGRAETVIAILDHDITESDSPLECTLEDVIEAVRNCGDRKSSLVYLKQECGVCYAFYPMTKIRNLGVCHCKLCEDCLRQNFEVAIREKYIRNWGCPLCEAPGLEDETKASEYFEFLSLQLQRLVSQEVMGLFETKLRDWHLQKDPNFRWCAQCASGFIWDRPQVLGMTCPSCGTKTCFECKKKWEDQHEGLTCEEYTQWTIDNDPEKQAKGIQLYLEENGIDCPSCKMRYSLAKGGCMHFKCPQCGHEFCSGCYQAFLHQGVCRLMQSCKDRGLHCHHPRDCYYYLRDYDPVDLQKLLKNHHIQYNTEVSPTQEDKFHCPVMVQKEFGSVKKDEACGGDTKKGFAGLCEGHYKEYLVGQINRSKIDPLAIMSTQQMKILIERNEKKTPDRGRCDENQYRKKLIVFIKEKFQLHR